MPKLGVIFLANAWVFLHFKAGVVKSYTYRYSWANPTRNLSGFCYSTELATTYLICFRFEKARHLAWLPNFITIKIQN